MTKTTLALDGKWEFKEYPASARMAKDLDASPWYKTKVPSSIFTSLVSAGQITKKDVEQNPETLDWVSEKAWVFRKKFNAPLKLIKCSKIELVFDGLDTIATVWLNGKMVARTDNMFIPHRVDITKKLRSEENILMVKFNSALQHGRKLMTRFQEFDGEDFINPERAYVRKSQFSFGWDFCPSLPGCGIWRGVRIEGFKKARISDVHIRTIDCNKKYADVRVAVKLDSTAREEFLCRLKIFCDKQELDCDMLFEPGQDYQSALIHIKEPLLWWPNGYGEQNFYQLDVSLNFGDEEIDHQQKSFGIRTVHLNRQDDKSGQKFQFEVNGKSVYIKGANWVGVSILAGDASAKDYEKFLVAAKDANFNMLRVWGGGYYENEEFYNLCDRLGILVWQDFMFACSCYPDTQEFSEQIKAEAAAIIKQLRNHPSLAIWCGNNEIDWMYETKKLGKGRKFNEKAIYHKLLPRLVAEFAPDHPYIATTPFGNTKKLNAPNSGTVHQWSVWSGDRPVSDFICPVERVPRFVTEFGLQSLADVKTTRAFCAGQNRRISNLDVEKHNYQIDGNSRLYRYAADLFGTVEKPEHFIYLSQLTQARAAKAYVEHLRTHKSRNDGVLFWQFNDCCPATSWSAIDCAKRPKALYYYAKRFFAQQFITIMPEFEKSKINLPSVLKSARVVAVNDTPEAVTAKLRCVLMDLWGNVIDELNLPISMAAFGTSRPLKLPKSIVLPENPQGSSIWMFLENDEKILARNSFFYLPDKYIDWPEAKISKKLQKINDEKYLLKIKSNAIVRDAKIEAPTDVWFDENYFDMMANEEKDILIGGKKPIFLVESKIKIQTVNSIFNKQSD